jgi:hypothetical protein
MNEITCGVTPSLTFRWLVLRECIDSFSTLPLHTSFCGDCIVTFRFNLPTNPKATIFLLFQPMPVSYSWRQRKTVTSLVGLFPCPSLPDSKSLGSGWDGAGCNLTRKASSWYMVQSQTKILPSSILCSCHNLPSAWPMKTTFGWIESLIRPTSEAESLAHSWWRGCKTYFQDCNDKDIRALGRLWWHKLSKKVARLKTCEPWWIGRWGDRLVHQQY